MSRIQVDNIYDKEGTGAPTFPSGAVVTGVCTATSFDGNMVGTAATFTTVEATTYIGVPAGTDVLESMLFS